MSIRRLIRYKSLFAGRYNEKVKKLMVTCEINRKLSTWEGKWDNFNDLYERMKLNVIDE